MRAGHLRALAGHDLALRYGVLVVGVRALSLWGKGHGEAALAVAEVVSPSTVSMDRAIKPVMYAEAEIPVYWRVELHDTPRIAACFLSRGRYVTRTTFVAGTPGRITRPFAVELDPADLTHRTA